VHTLAEDKHFGNQFLKGNCLKAYIAAHEYAHHHDIDLQWSISSSRSLNYATAALFLSVWRRKCVLHLESLEAVVAPSL
jgi:hypothetical protein